MNGYQLISKLQTKLKQDPEFAMKFNRTVNQLKNVPGLQMKILKIAQLRTEQERQRAINTLPKNARNAVYELLELLEK
ncbi:hypothetical protein [Clostridium sp. BJN0001]|uniref:hypothetical protein n=1 Tax=Clostridium sp. BJN0001 TaxID=2930219 RepID=UPI001FD437D4|nr:hypothetical protein [Clostridium sp. BJN0001]